MRNPKRTEVSYYEALQDEINKGKAQQQGLGVRDTVKRYPLKTVVAVFVMLALFFALGWIAGL